MNTVLLTIVFFASAANAEFMTRVEMSDAASCSALAERWLSYRDGMLRVTAARCDVAEAVGFEPTEGSPPRWFSRPVP